VLELAALVGEITGVDVNVRHVPAKPGEMARVAVDSSRARSFAWEPSVTLEQGLSRVWESWPGAAGIGQARRLAAGAGAGGPQQAG
jgi:nucleoside-diphosphate-sugar epimerase